MIFKIKRLLLGIILILIASLILLFSDLEQRKVFISKLYNIAILKYASRPTLDESQKGIIDGLKEMGFINGENVKISIFNSENDLPTANTISSYITSGRFNIVMSISTLCLQTVANANKKGKAIHIFCTVTDPASAGVGISRLDPYDHPKFMAGIGTFQPVKEVFRLAKKIYPGLKKVGTVWNPAEACSTACLEKAREICKQLSVNLIEVTVDNSAGVTEAVQSLLCRDIQAIWIGGDNTVEMAVESLAATAIKKNIPVFTNNPEHPILGALFALGANYYTVGKSAGIMAAKIINGKDPASIPIKNVVPQRLYINTTIISKLKDPWNFKDEIYLLADAIIDEKGLHKKSKN